MTERRFWGAPISVPLVVAAHLPTFILAPVNGHVSPGLIVVLLVIAAVLALLWRGSRVAWTIVLLLSAVSVVTQPIDPVAWWALALNVVSVGLLIAPMTQRHVWGRVLVLRGA